MHAGDVDDCRPVFNYLAIGAAGLHAGKLSVYA